MTDVSFGVFMLVVFIVILLYWGWRRRSVVNNLTKDRINNDLEHNDSSQSDKFDLQDGMASLSDAVMLLDSQGDIKWANKTACEWFDIRTDSIQSKFNYQFDMQNIDGFSEYLEKQNFGDSFECYAPAEHSIHLEIRIVPYRAGDLFLQGRDITKIKQLSQIRQDFVANASHELRTPLSILYGYLEMMQDEPNEKINEEWQPAVRQMFEQTERIKKIIDDMMLLSRLEDPDYEADWQYIEMARLVEKAGDSAGALSLGKGHRVILDIDENYSLLCHPSEIESLVMNLVSNAIRYTPGKGTITIKWKVDLAGGYLSVADTGIGIEAENIPRLTERFYRTDPARSKETGGTGLGLAIVNHIVNRHNATLLIQSTPDKGSEFTVHFQTDSIQSHRGQVNLLLN